MFDRIKQCTLIFILLCLECAYSNEPKFCSTRVVVTRDVYETYLRTYYAIKTKRCWYGRSQCTYSQRQTTIDGRMVPKIVVDTKPVCCDGYIETDSLETPCEPVCIPLCRNGVCSRPGECSCHEGYVSDNSTKHSCLPVCNKDCGHGVCTQPNYCTCSFGYAYQNQTCVPICNESCLNGTCVAPGSCECWPGFRKSESNNCKPYCSRGCVHGSCISPETCACDEGYRQEEMGKCTPICDPACGNGTCVAPNVCECFTGYNLSPKKTCEPYCSKALEHATCVAPETYVCEDGYRREIEKCTPHCVNACGNGTCIAPNVCECFAGYKINLTILIESGNGSLCVPECKNCKGSCVSPNVCICEPPYKIMKTTIDGESCCDNCASTNRCEVTTCVLPTTSEELSTTEMEREESFSDSYENVDTISSIPYSSDIDIASSTKVNYKTSDDYYEDTERPSRSNNEFVPHEYVTTEAIIVEADLKSKKNENQGDTFSYWIIGLVLCIILIIVTIILFVKKKSISHYFKGGSYVVEDNVSSDVCQSKPLPEYQYSTMLQKSEKEYSDE